MSEENTFLLNDINLSIPPENISIQQEDLIYTWKTLRTGTTTKIPSGHGQNVVQFRIPFMDNDILKLHRFLIEVKNSPFCSVENLFLRQSLMPDWPLGQKMAFTMTGLDVMPYPGTTNAWILNVDCNWFNYFPYTHNWLYRRDWTTEWISGPASTAEPYYVKYSIGWDNDSNGNMKGIRLSVVEEKSSADSSEVLSWDQLNEKYISKELTIEDFELLHRGSVFDSSPLPSRMQPSDPVGYASESLIYKRYYNFLQRDALKRNFDIDVEDIIGYKPDSKELNILYQLLFSKFIFYNSLEEDPNKYDRIEYTLGLHERLPVELANAYDGLQEQWSQMQAIITERILLHKDKVRFAFSTYKSVKLPLAASKAAQKIFKEVVKDTNPTRNLQNKDGWIYSDNKKIKMRVRSGLSEPSGFHVPLGKTENGQNFTRTFEDLTEGKYDFMHWRHISHLYKGSGRQRVDRFHEGMDISGDMEKGKTPVFAVKDGIVKRVVDGINETNTGVPKRWVKVYKDGAGAWLTETIDKASLPSYADWHNSALAILKTQDEINNADVGTIIASIDFDNTFYYVDYGDSGKYIMLSHNNDNEISVYMHLNEIIVRSGSVKAGDIIGYVGNTSSLEVNQMIDAYEGKYSIDEAKLISTVPVHLHFEYLEKISFHSERNVEVDDKALVKYSSSAGSQYVHVDPRPTWEWASQNGYTDFIDETFTKNNATLEALKEALAEEKELSGEDKLALEEALDYLFQEGYYYYDQQSDITNVWYKPWRIELQLASPETLEYDQILRTDTAILTNLSGGFRHIVANIPILGHQFPTHQHLGSIEPYYNLEFHLLDDTFTLEGIGERGGVLSSIKSLLQHNARDFRLIPDSWALITDTFITRLLGSMSIEDLRYSQSGEDSLVTDVIMKKRTLITRSQQDTVPGNPGLSRMLFELQETNPYSNEALTANAPPKESVDSVRSKVLNNLYNLEFDDGYQEDILKLIIAQKAGVVSDLNQTNYGKFSAYFASGWIDVDKLDGNRALAWTSLQGAIDPLQKLTNSTNLSANSEHYSLKTNLINLQNKYVAEGKPLGYAERVFLLEDPGGNIYQTLSANGINVVNDGGYTFVAERETGLKEFDTGSTGRQNKFGVRVNSFNVYDISKWLNQNTDMMKKIELPINKLYDLLNILKNIMETATVYIAEDRSLLSDGEIEGETLSTDEVSKKLYGLPIEPALFRTYQEYLLNTASFFYPDSTTLLNQLAAESDGYVKNSFMNRVKNPKAFYTNAKALLEKNENWLFWTKDTEYSKRFNMSWSSIFWKALNSTPIMMGVNLAIDQVKRFGYYASSSPILPANWGKDIPTYWAATFKEQCDAINNSIAAFYVASLPLTILAGSEWIKNYIEDSYFGDIASLLTGEASLPAIANTKTLLVDITKSSGYFGPHPWWKEYPIFLEPTFASSDAINDFSPIRDDDGNLLPGVTEEEIKLGYRIKKSNYVESILDSLLMTSWIAKENHHYSATTFFAKSGVFYPGSPFKWQVNKGIEQEKLNYFAQLLARLADRCMEDPGIMKLLGLNNLNYSLNNTVIKGKECYPDLTLPYHPYYQDKYSVQPDFYMWNLYEDGQLFSKEMKEEIARSSYTILENCYKSMKSLGENKKSTQLRKSAIQEPNTVENVALNIRYNAEGKEGMGTPFYPNKVSETSIEQFYKDLENPPSSSGTDTREIVRPDLDSDEIANIKSVKPKGIKLENNSGYYGAGSGVLYPSRLTSEGYLNLKKQVEDIEEMFGSRAGYLEKHGKKELPDDTLKRIASTPLSRDAQPSHLFDLKSLKQLADVSSADLFSEQRRMSNAYPTFKLYFVEEDEQENRLLNYDDFYSYNGVKDISVTLSRNNAADMAIITVQNVSGILDGTKRDAIVDLDYFSTYKNKANIAGDATLSKTIEDQPFGALVLRPGLNAQLRMGYSNDPDNLPVLINGRIVDVQWNQQGDMAQIMIQGFGAELSQILKGTETNTTDVFWTTHQLLSSLMLEPELQHFGRWEIGQLYDTHEAIDARFDFFDYAREANLGSFGWSSDAVRFLFNHQWIMYLLAFGGVAALSKLPLSGSLFSRLSRWGVRSNVVNRILGSTGIFGRIGEKAFEKELIVVSEQALPKAVIGPKLLVTAESAVTRETIEASFAKYSGALGSRALSMLRKDSPKFAEELALAIEGAFLRQKDILLQQAGTVTIGNAAKGLAAAEAEASTILLKGQWMSNPTSIATGIEMIKDVGWKPVSTLIEGSFYGIAKIIGITATAGLAIDLANITGLTRDVYDGTLGKAERFFSAAQISLMLSPQDDNLFPPHPKDYMLINRPILKKLQAWTAWTGASAFLGDELGNLVGHYFADEDPFDKKSSVEAYQYKINNSYIWDIFKEMTLRHPGWVYGVRPYGTKFRYTMFFGVPSQRYWAKPAENEFIYRANRVFKALEGDVNVQEYRLLYGETFDNMSIAEYDKKLEEEAHKDLVGFVPKQKKAKIYDGEEIKYRADGTGYVDSGRAIAWAFVRDGYVPDGTLDEQKNKYYQEKLKALRAASYSARALKEYMTALNLRFVPFRRYHTFSSDSNLVWNGIMGSENASFNAVDVVYGSEDTEETGPSGSVLVKAHAFLPESKLRAKPLDFYPNCRGYSMGMRYGMGELMWTLRDMYRGEIIVRGNARILPWDIAILQDTYNSMVGPVEIEQVVHNFSHETGFITEVKPSAVVLANETSSWPLLEAMKLVSLAVTNVEKDALGLTVDSFGSALTAINMITNWGPGNGSKSYEDYALRKMKEIFGDNWDQEKGKLVDGTDLSLIVFGKEQPENIAKVSQKIDEVGTGIKNTALVLSAVTSIGLGFVSYKTRGLLGGTVVGRGITRAGFSAAAAGTLGSGYLYAADKMIDAPTLIGLLGGSLLLLQCLRGDSVMIVPLQKNGFPIVAGLNYSDPNLVWKNFLGNLGRYADDVIGGTRDLLDLWQTYGSYIWRRLPSNVGLDTNRVLTNVNTTGN